MATEIAKAEQFNASFQGMSQLPAVRQIGLLIGLAVSIAVAIWVVMWSQTPNYSVLYHNVSTRDAGDIIDLLQKEKIKYQIDTQSGVLLVESRKLHDARIALAAQNLPNQAGQGFEIINKEQGFGTSDLIQTARYQRALEGELATTIMSLAAVENARVHLALPKESAFIRDRRRASASVLLNLATGRKLENEQVSAIMNLVASSVGNMQPEQVTVVDSRGHLLSKSEGMGGIGTTARQFEYTRQVEAAYVERIENILSPIVGANKVRAQVTVDMDFTRVEMTQESFNPDLPAVRSEQTVEENSRGAAFNAGIPGALSNEPPGPAQAPEQTGQNAAAGAETTPAKSKRRSTRNYELDRSIVHKRQNPGVAKRLSVAVVVDNKQSVNEEGQPLSIAYKPEELARFTTLVKEAVGFNILRGDTVNVINAEFTPPPQLGPPAEQSFLDQPWVWDLGKQLLGGIIAAILLFGVLKPVMRNLSRVPATAMTGSDEDSQEDLADDQLTLSEDTGPRLPKPNEYESDLDMARSMVVQEPKRVAQVVKQWINE